MRQEVIQKAPEQAKKSKPNLTGIPTQMKLDFEQRSGLSFDDVRVHYNSDKPRKIGALAYTQGNQVHVGPGQERHLRHELGHVVQQKSFNITPTKYMQGVAINDARIYEKTADTNPFSKCNTDGGSTNNDCYITSQVIQRLVIPIYVNNVLQALKSAQAPNIGQLNQIISEYGIVNATVSQNTQTQKFVLAFTDGSQVLSFDTWVDLVSYIIRASRDANEAEVTQAKQVKFGFELTFNNATDFGYSLVDLCAPSPKIEKAKSLLLDFANAICKAIKLLRGMDFVICDVKVQDSTRKKWANAGFTPQTISVIYRKKLGQQSEEPPITMEFCTVDLDPSCIEVQTYPIEYKKLLTDESDTLYKLLVKTIFDSASTVELSPASNPETGGGGHISIDVASAFLNEGHYLRNFFVHYLQQSKTTGSIFQRSQDIDNAPFPHEIDAEKGIQRAIRQFDGLPKEKQTIEEFVKMINKEYAGHGIEKLKSQIRTILSQTQPRTQKVRDDEIKSQMIHYQAVNLEHIIGEPKATQRIEMRRFDAQQNLGELQEQITELLKLILFSRQKPMIPMLYP